MSRGQQGQVTDLGNAENRNYNNMATTSFNTATGAFSTAQGDLGTVGKDINNYASEVGAFKAANPYVQGGQFQTAQNQQLSDTAAGGAESAGQALQSQAVRTGQNAGGAIAATENMQAQNQRALAGEEAAATQQRIGAGTGYNEAVMQGTGNIAGMRQNLANSQTALGGEESKMAGEEGGFTMDALGQMEKAAQTPSFMDELGQGLINTGEDFAKAYAGGKFGG